MPKGTLLGFPHGMCFKLPPPPFFLIFAWRLLTNIVYCSVLFHHLSTPGTTHLKVDDTSTLLSFQLCADLRGGCLIGNVGPVAHNTLWRDRHAGCGLTFTRGSKNADPRSTVCQVTRWQGQLLALDSLKMLINGQRVRHSLVQKAMKPLITRQSKMVSCCTDDWIPRNWGNVDYNKLSDRQIWAVNTLALLQCSQLHDHTAYIFFYTMRELSIFVSRI